ncbi:hypothetical protein A9W99_18705 [Mycobacterium sp. 1164966.3]|nr:hypothetical protein A9W99_18705 [Mycobacterium sp. 1164966.3]
MDGVVVVLGGLGSVALVVVGVGVIVTVDGFGSTRSRGTQVQFGLGSKPGGTTWAGGGLGEGSAR